MYGTTDNLPDQTDPQRNGTELRLRHAMAGLQAGVVGTIAMFAWLMIASLWHGRSIWVVPNLFSTTFFGSDAYRNQLLATSWAGVALTVAFYGALGTIWGSVWRQRSVRWLPVYGAVTGIVVYFFVYHYIWRRLNPLVPLYAPDRQLELAHIFWGMLLARSPLYARRIADSAAVQEGRSPSAPPPLPSPPLELDQTRSEMDQHQAAYAVGNQPAAEPEIKRGEVIL